MPPKKERLRFECPAFGLNPNCKGVTYKLASQVQSERVYCSRSCRATILGRRPGQAEHLNRIREKSIAVCAANGFKNLRVDAVRARKEKAVGFYYNKKYKYLTNQYGHPLADTNGVVGEHRKTLYDAMGPGPHPCHWCRRPLGWLVDPPARLETDHLNHVSDDNRLENLVPACRSCNQSRMLKHRWGTDNVIPSTL